MKKNKQGETGQEMISALQEQHEDRSLEAGKPKVSLSGKDMLLSSYFENKGMNVYLIHLQHGVWEPQLSKTQISIITRGPSHKMKWWSAVRTKRPWCGVSLSAGNLDLTESWQCDLGLVPSSFWVCFLISDLRITVVLEIKWTNPSKVTCGLLSRMSYEYEHP